MVRATAIAPEPIARFRASFRAVDARHSKHQPADVLTSRSAWHGMEARDVRPAPDRLVAAHGPASVGVPMGGTRAALSDDYAGGVPSYFA